MNLTADQTWSLGILLGLPIGIVVVLLLIGGGLAILKFDDFSGEMGWMPLGMGVILALILCGVYYPYSAEYHQWRPVVGTVTAIDSRILTTGSGDSASVNTRFVVDLTDQTAGDPAATGGQYACDDTRCAQVRPGDVVGLSCKRHWQFSGTDGYDCNYVGRKAA